MRCTGGARRSPADGLANLGVAAATLSQRRDSFLPAGDAALTSKPQSSDGLEAETPHTPLGEVQIERELHHETITILETKRPLAGGRASHEPAHLLGHRRAASDGVGLPGLAADALQRLP